MDGAVRIDGHFRRVGMEQGLSPQMGKNRIVPLWVPIVVERLLEHCVLRIQIALFRLTHHHCPAHYDRPYHTVVQGGEQSCRLSFGTLPAVGLFCHGPQFCHLADELMYRGRQQQMGPCVLLCGRPIDCPLKKRYTFPWPLAGFLSLPLGRYPLRGQIGPCPCILKIKTPGNGINVQDLAGKKEIGQKFTPKILEIHFF